MAACLHGSDFIAPGGSGSAQVRHQDNVGAKFAPRAYRASTPDEPVGRRLCAGPLRLRGSNSARRERQQAGRLFPRSNAPTRPRPDSRISFATRDMQRQSDHDLLDVVRRAPGRDNAERRARGPRRVYTSRGVAIRPRGSVTAAPTRSSQNQVRAFSSLIQRITGRDTDVRQCRNETRAGHHDVPALLHLCGRRSL